MHIAGMAHDCLTELQYCLTHAMQNAHKYLLVHNHALLLEPQVMVIAW